MHFAFEFLPPVAAIMRRETINPALARLEAGAMQPI